MKISPKTAYKRALYQSATRNLYNLDDRRNIKSGWTAIGGTAEASNKISRDITRARARELENNSDMLPAQILALVRNVVGTGIILQARVKTDEGNDDEKLNASIEELWNDWCKPSNCDIQGRMSFDEIQEMCVRRMFVDGGILVIKCYDDKQQFKLQLKEVDYLDISLMEHGGNKVEGGIELDKYDKAVAYHIKQYDKLGSYKTNRVEAKNVCYLANITRPSQIREFSPAAPSLGRIDDTNELIGSAVMKERVLSYFALFLTNSGGYGGGAVGRGMGFGLEEKNTGVYPEEPLEQGMLKRLKPGEDVKTINPSGVSSTASDIARLTQRLSGSSVGLSYEATSRDMSQVNYSSARQGMLEDQRTYKRWQKNLITHLCDSVYLEWLDWIVLNNKLKIPNYYKDKFRYRRCVWISSGWDWIDPLKESKANREALESGQTTLQDICATAGKDWREVIYQRALETKLQSELLGIQTIEVSSDDEKNLEKEARDIEVNSQLNGAQIDSLVKISCLVASGELSYESALQIVMAAYPYDEATAKKMLNNGQQIKPIGDDENGS